MREIKYRAWSKSERRMFNVLHISFARRECYGGWPDLIVWWPFDDVELMDYINLKDKREREIYEGDIVKEIFTLHTVYWSEGDCGFSPFIKGKLNSKTCEVLGNIYDNPELLRGNDDPKRK